jgi:hypothetical protein
VRQAHFDVRARWGRPWVDSNITIKKDLPKNYAQLFYEAYTKQKTEFFSSKPSGDFTNDGQHF